MNDEQVIEEAEALIQWETPEHEKEVKDWLRSTLSRVRAEERKRAQPIFDWLLGTNGDFPNLADKPHYRFRTELRERLNELYEPHQ